MYAPEGSSAMKRKCVVRPTLTDDESNSACAPEPGGVGEQSSSSCALEPGGEPGAIGGSGGQGSSSRASAPGESVGQSSSMSASECPGCLECFDDDKSKEILWLPCLHAVHLECWCQSPWKQARCPLCRFDPMSFPSHRGFKVCKCPEDNPDPCQFHWISKGWKCVYCPW